MRFSFWTSVGALVVLSAASCTPSENKTAAAPSPAVSPAKAPVVAAAASPVAEASDAVAEQLRETLTDWIVSREVSARPPKPRH